MKRVEIYENGRIYISSGCSTMVGVPDNLGELLQVIDGGDEVARFHWSEAYLKLKDRERDLIQIFFPGLEKRVTEKTKSVEKLMSRIYSWCLSKEPLRVTCSRCGGTGHYSYNQRDGTRCFKCWGKKHVLPSLSKKWVALVAEEHRKAVAETEKS